MEPCCLGAILDSTEGGRHGTAHVVHRHHAGPPSLRPRLDPRHAHVFRAPPTHCSAVGGTAHAPLLPAVRFACRAVALAPRRRPPAQAPRARQHCCSSSGQSHQVHARRAERDLASHAGRSKTVVGSVPALLFLRRAPKITKMRGVSKEAGVCCAVGGGLVRARPPPTLGPASFCTHLNGQAVEKLPWERQAQALSNADGKRCSRPSTARQAPRAASAWPRAASHSCLLTLPLPLADHAQICCIEVVHALRGRHAVRDKNHHKKSRE